MKNRIKGKTMEFITQKGYAALVRKAEEFAESLTGDSGYESPECNKVALEAMLIGWLRGTPRWKVYEQYIARYYPRTNLYLLAQDQATQAAQDALFDGTDSYVSWFYTEKELNQLLDGSSPWTKTVFAAKIQQAKRNLGISLNA